MSVCGIGTGRDKHSAGYTLDNSIYCLCGSYCGVITGSTGAGDLYSGSGYPALRQSRVAGWWKKEATPEVLHSMGKIYLKGG